MNSRLILILGIASLIMCHEVKADAITYSFPPELDRSNMYQATVDDTSIPVLQTKLGAFINFGMTGPVKVKLTLSKPPANVVVRPLHAGISAEISGKECTFTLASPQNCSVEFDGDLTQPLLVFANPALAAPPDRDDPTVKYFEAGKIHEAGEIWLKDNETLYMEGGAVVHGVVRSHCATNVSIRGAGIFDCRPRKHKINMLVFRECTNASIENIILIDSLGWSIHLSGSKDITLCNTRVLGWRANGDGLDIEYCRNVTVKSAFWRTYDDCIAIKALYPPGIKGIPLNEMIDPETLGRHKVPRIAGDVIGDILITDSVLWNDRPGNGFEIGFELRVDTLRNITLRNCDIIHVIRGAAFSIHNADRASIENVLLDNVRVEDTAELIDLYVGMSIYSDDCPLPYRRSNPERIALPKKNRDSRAADNAGQWFYPSESERPLYKDSRGRISGVVVRDMNVVSAPKAPSIISGYDSEHGVSNVVFERLTIQGKPITSADKARLFLRHAHNVEFR